MKKYEKMNPVSNAIVDELMHSVILKHTCHILKNEKPWEPIISLGSGVFVEIGGNYYMLTASHVAVMKERGIKLCVPMDDRFIEILGEWKISDIERSNNIDLAYVKLYSALADELKKHYSFLPLNKIGMHDMLVDNMNQYIIVGFPEKFNKNAVNQASEAVGLILPPAKVAAYEYYKFNPRTHHILDMNGKNYDIRTSQKTKGDNDHHGLSGSGIYQLFFKKDLSSYFVDYKLISIMTDKRVKHYSLIGNRIEIVLQMIMNG